MHTHPAALEHLKTIRNAVAVAVGIDAEVHLAAADLVDRLEMLYKRQILSKANVLLALEAFIGIPGTDESVAALRAIATGLDA